MRLVYPLVVVCLALCLDLGSARSVNVVYDVKDNTVAANPLVPSPPPFRQALWRTNKFLRTLAAKPKWVPGKFNPSKAVPAKTVQQPAVGPKGAPTLAKVVAPTDAAGSCYTDVHAFSEDHVCFSRAVVNNEPKEQNNKGPITTNVKSCRSVAFFLDYLFANETYTSFKNHAPHCDESGNKFWHCFSNTSVLASISKNSLSRTSMFWHFRLPADIHMTPGDEHNVGHHWTIEMTFRNNEPSFIIYMSYQDMYPLSNWLDKTEKPKQNMWAGGEKFTLDKVKQHLAQVQDLVNLMKAGSSCSDISRIYQDITGVSFPDLKEPRNCNVQDPKIARVLVAELPYNAETCRAHLKSFREHCKPGQKPRPEDLFY